MVPVGLAGAPAPDAVLRRLARVAEPDGFLRFDRFMETVLYDHEVGYYGSPRGSPFGGDFYTAPHVHPLFGATLAGRVLAEYRALGEPRRFRIVEVGPGDGTLARQVIGSISSSVPEGGVWEYVLVERSAALREKLVDEFARLSTPHNVEVRFAEALGADGPFRGILLANELLDALPARRLIWREGAWHEQGVQADAGVLSWTVRPLSTLVPGPPLPRGRREDAILEIEQFAESFLREISDHLESGSAILIDFGYSEEELVAARTSGTLVATRHHQAEVDPLAHPGEADLSVFLNFTRLRAAAHTSGLEELSFRTQAEALGEWGLPTQLSDAISTARDDVERVKTQLAAKNLLFGFENFYALELTRGLRAGPSASREPQTLVETPERP